MRKLSWTNPLDTPVIRGLDLRHSRQLFIRSPHPLGTFPPASGSPPKVTYLWGGPTVAFRTDGIGWTDWQTQPQQPSALVDSPNQRLIPTPSSSHPVSLCWSVQACGNQLHNQGNPQQGPECHCNQRGCRHCPVLGGLELTDLRAGFLGTLSRRLPPGTPIDPGHHLLRIWQT